MPLQGPEFGRRWVRPFAPRMEPPTAEELATLPTVELIVLLSRGLVEYDSHASDWALVYLELERRFAKLDLEHRWAQLPEHKPR